MREFEFLNPAPCCFGRSEDGENEVRVSRPARCKRCGKIVSLIPVLDEDGLFVPLLGETGCCSLCDPELRDNLIDADGFLCAGAV